MIKLKDIIFENIDILYMARRAWKSQATDEMIERYVDTFTILKNSRFISGQISNIFSWIKKPFSEFQKYIDLTSSEYEKRLSKKSQEKDVDKIFENEEVLIISPRTYESSCKYGSNTKWCVSGTNTKNHWDSYVRNGARLYFIISKKTYPWYKNPMNKIIVSRLPNGKLSMAADSLNQEMTLKKLGLFLKSNNVPDELFNIKFKVIKFSILQNLLKTLGYYVIYDKKMDEMIDKLRVGFFDKNGVGYDIGSASEGKKWGDVDEYITFNCILEGLEYYWSYVFDGGSIFSEEWVTYLIEPPYPDMKIFEKHGLSVDDIIDYNS